MTHPREQHSPSAWRKGRWLVPDPWRRWLILFVFATLLALSITDKYFQEERENWQWACLGVLVALDCPAPWTGARRRQTLWRAGFASGALVTVGLAAVMTCQIVHRAGIATHDAWNACKIEHGWAVMGVGLWLVSSWAWAAWRRRGRRATGGFDWLEASVFCLTALEAWCFITAMASLNPRRSYNYFATEIGSYVPLTLFWARHARLDGALQAGLKRWTLRLLAAGVIAGTFILAAYLLADPAMKLRMENFQWQNSLLITPTRYHGKTVAWRLTFPFGHHNRMAYFSMLAAAGLAAAALGSVKWLRAVWGCLMALALINMLATLNRGVLVALALGVAFATRAWLGRRAWFLLLLAPVAFALLPTTQRQRVMTIFDPMTYAQRGSTVVSRFALYRVAMLMTRDNPVVGIGYGWKHFEKTNRDLYSRSTEDGGEAVTGEFVHAHNVWLEQSAETGLPGLVLFLAWSAWRWAALARAWRRRAALPPNARAMLLFWITLEIAIQCYCLVNYPLRRGLGIMTWQAWGMMSVDLAIWGRVPRGPSPDDAGDGPTALGVEQ